MKTRSTAASLLLLCALGARSQERLTLASGAEADGGFALSLGAVSGPLAAALVLRGQQPTPDSLRFGLACPWFRLGSLAERGLLRQVDNPLGFRVGSEVFRQETDLVLERTPSDAGFSVLLSPVPGNIAIFGRYDETNAFRLGGVAGLAPFPSLRAETLADLTTDGTCTVVHAGGDACLDLPGVFVSLCGVLSDSGTGPPGALWSADIGVGGKPLRLEAYGSAVDQSYLTWRGLSSPRSLAWGCRVSSQVSRGTVEASYSALLDRPTQGSTVISSKEEVSFSAEEALIGSQDTGLRLKIAGKNHQCFRATGDRLGQGECSAVLEGALHGTVSTAGFGVKGGLPCVTWNLKSPIASTVLQCTGDASFANQSCVLAASFSLSVKLGCGLVNLQAGLNKLSLPGEFADCVRSLRFSASFQTCATSP